MNSITKIKPSLRRKGYFSVFLDEMFWASINSDGMAKFSLTEGKDLSDGEIRSIESYMQSTRLHERIYQFVQLRPHSEKEIENYLKYRLKLSEHEIDTIISRLKSEGSISDDYFCNWYIDSKLEKKNYGYFRYQFELSKKGISKELITNIVNSRIKEILDTDTIKIQRFIKENKNKREPGKIIASLKNKGFRLKEIQKETTKKLSSTLN